MTTLSSVLRRLVCAALVSCAALGTAYAEDVVSLTVTKPSAFESNTAGGYGEIQVARDGTLGNLRVYLKFPNTSANLPPQTQGTVAFTDYVYDCDVRYVLPSGQINTTDLSTLPDGQPIPDRQLTTRIPYDTVVGSFYVTIPSGSRSVRIRAYAWKEALDVPAAEAALGLFAPEGGEPFTLALDADLPNSAPVKYTIAAQQAGQITIIDANITLAVRVDDPIADEQDSSANDPGFVDQRVRGNMRMWFENSSRRNGPSTTASPVVSYSPNISRKVELTKSGTFAIGTDGICAMTIGGGLNSDRGGLRNTDKDIPTIVNKWAYRLRDEYGTLQVADPTTAATTAAGSGFQIIRMMAGGLPLDISQVRVIIESITPAITLPAPVTTVTAGNTVTGITTKSVSGLAVTSIVSDPENPGIVLVTLASPLVVNIENGSVVKFVIETSAEVAAVAATATSPGSPAGIKTTLSSVETKINNPVMYKAGVFALGFSVDPTAINSTLPFVGDQVHINGDIYRVIGPTPRPDAGHPSGYSTVLSSLEANQSAAGTGYIIVWPPLLADIKRKDEKPDTGFGIQTQFPLTFPAENGFKEIVTIVEMPTVANVDGFGHPAFFPNSLPFGDWVDIMIQVDPDTAVEGAEYITVTANSTTANTGYDILTPQSGTIWIQDNDSTASIETRQNGIEPGAPGTDGQPMIFTVRLSQPFSKDIQIPFTILSDGSTTATPPTVSSAGDFTVVNYDLPAQRGIITLSAGTQTASIRVDPTFNGTVNTVVKSMGIQLLTSLDYRLLSTQGGRNNTVATATIQDNDGSVVIPPSNGGNTGTAPSGTATSTAGAGNGVYSGSGNSAGSGGCGAGGLGMVFAPMAWLLMRRRQRLS